MLKGLELGDADSRGISSIREGVVYGWRPWRRAAKLVITANRASTHLIRLLLCLVYGSKTLALASNITSMIGMVSSTPVGV